MNDTGMTHAISCSQTLSPVPTWIYEYMIEVCTCVDLCVILCLCGIYTCVVHTSTIRARISDDFPCNPRSSHAAEAAIGQTSGRPYLSKTAQKFTRDRSNTMQYT